MRVRAPRKNYRVLLQLAFAWVSAFCRKSEWIDLSTKKKQTNKQIMGMNLELYPEDCIHTTGDSLHINNKQPVTEKDTFRYWLDYPLPVPPSWGPKQRTCGEG